MTTELRLRKKINALFSIRTMVNADIMTMKFQMKVCVSCQLFPPSQKTHVAIVMSA